MSMFLDDIDKLPPISFGSRGFITHDGEVIGWSIVAGDHNSYHIKNGTSDDDFYTRWRKWNGHSLVEFDNGVHPDDEKNLAAWLEDHADDKILLP